MLAVFSLGVGSPTTSQAHAKANSAPLLGWDFFPAVLRRSRRRWAWLLLGEDQPSKPAASCPRGFLSSCSLCQHLQHLNARTHATMATMLTQEYNGGNLEARSCQK